MAATVPHKVANCCNTPDNQIIVEKLLTDLTNMSRIATINKDNSAHFASIRWYTNMVFSRNNQFDLSYLDIFDKYFWLSIKYIIAHNERQIFEGLVSTVTQGRLFQQYGVKCSGSYVLPHIPNGL